MNVIVQSFSQILSDPVSLLAFLSASATIYFSQRTIQYFDYKKKNPNNPKRIVLLPATIKAQIDKFDDQQIAEVYKREIIDFYDILRENVSQDVLVNFNNNINDVNINKAIIELIKSGAAGFYTFDNEIFLLPFSEKCVLTHELLHLASSVYNPTIDAYYSGFMQDGIGLHGETINIGRSFNEGYTELLNRRFFYPNSKSAPTYEYMVSITRSMERVVGKELMTECYFKADFGTVCNEMLKYIDMNKLQEFLSKAEGLFYLFSEDPGNTMIDYNKIRQQFLDVNYILIEAYINKLKMDNRYSDKTVRRFIKHLPCEFSKGENIYSFKIDPDRYLMRHNSRDIDMSSRTL